MTSKLAASNLLAMRTPGERLKWALFEVGGLSLRRCDALVGKTPGHLQAIASGTIREPRASTLAKYATLGSLSLEWVLTGRGDAPSEEQIRQSIAGAKAPKKRGARKPPVRGPGARRAAPATPEQLATG